jgi:hypothetical protein
LCIIFFFLLLYRTFNCWLEQLVQVYRPSQIRTTERSSIDIVLPHDRNNVTCNNVVTDNADNNVQNFNHDGDNENPGMEGKIKLLSMPFFSSILL